MAVLEKIRSKSALLLIVIGVALFAFIIGDFLNSGSTFFGDRTTIASVGSTDINIMDFQKRYDAVNQQYQQQNYTIDAAFIQQQVLDQMINEALFNEEMDALGITVTDKELSDAMIGANALPQMWQFANQFGAESPAQLHDLIFNPTKYQLPAEQAAQFQAMWLEQEEQIDQMLRMRKFGNLLTGAITANNLDAKALYDENAATSQIAFVKKSLSSLTDDKYEVSDADINALWNEEKNNHKLAEETRIVKYIRHDITPSNEDRIAAQQTVEEAIVRLKTMPGTDGVSHDVNFGVERISQPISKINNVKLKEFATNAKVDSVAVIMFPTGYSKDEYTIAKLLGSKVEVDSINISMLAFQGEAVKRDSILKALNSGADFAEIAKTEGVQGSQADTWLSMANETSSIKEKLLKEATGKYFIADSSQNVAVIYCVNERKAPVAIYDIANISYKVEPSQNTINNELNKLYDFLAKHNTDTAFNNMNAQAAGFYILTAEVTSSTPSVGNIQESRDAVKWVMDANKGDVSDIFRDQKDLRLLAVSLTDIYEDYVPARDAQIHSDLTIKARNNKKADDLIAQYEGKANNLTEYAALMEAQVDTAQVTFGQQVVAGLGGDVNAVIGNSVAAETGKVVGPIKTNDAVVVFSVIGTDTRNREYNYDENAAKFNSQFGADAVGNRIYNILRNGKEIKNNMLKFYNN